MRLQSTAWSRFLPVAAELTVEEYKTILHHFLQSHTITHFLRSSEMLHNKKIYCTCTLTEKYTYNEFCFHSGQLNSRLKSSHIKNNSVQLKCSIRIKCKLQYPSHITGWNKFIKNVQLRSIKQSRLITSCYHWKGLSFQYRANRYSMQKCKIASVKQNALYFSPLGGSEGWH